MLYPQAVINPSPNSINKSLNSVKLCTSLASTHILVSSTNSFYEVNNNFFIGSYDIFNKELGMSTKGVHIAPKVHNLLILIKCKAKG